MNSIHAKEDIPGRRVTDFVFRFFKEAGGGGDGGSSSSHRPCGIGGD